MNMPTIDWIHVAAFIAGLALQFFTSRINATPAVPQPTPSPTPAPVPGPESKPLLDLVHKLLDQRPATPPLIDPQTLQALMGVVNKVLDQPAAPTPSAKA
jgi:hypothetical protein